MTLDELEIKRLKRKCFYTRKETDEILKNISQKVVVDELPLTGIENYIYAIPTQNENEYNQYVWNNNLWESLGTTLDTLTDYVTQPELELELNKKKLYTEVTWQELKDLRDTSKLSPGSLYRITDYQCTTTQENTKSAGHQFNIVLLALSENKLAEEGWAMMHDNIYDVTFNDGVTKKCYLYGTGNGEYNIVDVQTLLGIERAINNQEIIINEDDKTVLMDDNNGYASSNLNIPNITYNYFQNSKLEAWKVWYCLDNDKSRFAWADDSLDEGTKATIIVSDISCKRKPSGDKSGKYAWSSEEILGNYYTDSETPNIGDSVYSLQISLNDKPSFKISGEIQNFIPGQKGTSKKESISIRDYINNEFIAIAAKYSGAPQDNVVINGVVYYLWIVENNNRVFGTLSRLPKVNDAVYCLEGLDITPDAIGEVIAYQQENLVYNGRGVIYRLIDEWNNDCPYDFKNILKKIPYYTLDTEYAYTFDLRNIDTGEIMDGSLCIVTASEDEEIYIVAHSNYIHGSYMYIGPNISRQIDYVRLCGKVTYKDENGYMACRCRVLYTSKGVISTDDVCLIYCSLSNNNVFNNRGVYINNEKVVTEPLS